MDPRLDDEARAVATMARNCGLMPYSFLQLWAQTKPFCLDMDSDGR